MQAITKHNISARFDVGKCIKMRIKNVYTEIQTRKQTLHEREIPQKKKILFKFEILLKLAYTTHIFYALKIDL